ncbi:MAG: enoyl-CoA hydratase/isomerase family protein, partial [Acidobacteria bacterium]|nr:enoyl-CoA hydratase/isomerase family protein [Acidobacteriota bacterium]
MTSFTTQISNGIARLEFNLPGEPVNKISHAVRLELESLLDSLGRDSDVRAVVLISGKQDNFIAGADINEFVALETQEDALALIHRGQELINRFENLGKPVLAAIHGACLGAGLEAALACTYRIATDHPKTILGLPEVQIGILPAAGGCQRLPRLIGTRAALDIILPGKRVAAGRAFKLGMVDELVPPDSLDDASMAAARRLGGGWRPKRSGGGVMGALLDKNPLGRRIVFGKARKAVLKKTGTHYPGPLAALDAVEHGLKHGVKAGLEREALHFAELAVGDVSRNLMRIFFANAALKKDPGVE